MKRILLKTVIKKISFKIFIGSICCLMLCPNILKAEERSWEIWQEAYLYSSIGKRFSMGLLMNNLYSSTHGNYDWFMEGAIKYKFNKWLNVEGLYRQEYFKIGSEWTYENRPMVRFSGSKQLGNWKVRNRHRFEMRFFEFGDSKSRYRTDLKVSPLLNLTAWKWNPYISEELFLSKGIVSKVRSYLGFQGKKGRMEPSAYLLIQSDLMPISWKHLLVGGISLGIEI